MDTIIVIDMYAKHARVSACDMVDNHHAGIARTSLGESTARADVGPQWLARPSTHPGQPEKRIFKIPCPSVRSEEIC